jgi:hypothetical protein
MSLHDAEISSLKKLKPSIYRRVAMAAGLDSAAFTLEGV